MKRFQKATVILLLLLLLCTPLLCAAEGGLQDVLEEPEAPPEITVSIQAPTNEVTVLNRITLSAVVQGTDETPKFSWKSSSPTVATVSSKGEVLGLTVGKTTITVTAQLSERMLQDSMEVFVVQPGNAVHNVLRDREILGYQYSYKDDYYYTNDRQCWQRFMGFSKFYDLVAPYMMLEYDYVRVYFTYGGKDWMIQLWKGQYGAMFYGSEIGVYTKNHSAKDPGTFTLYQCAGEGDYLGMEMTLFHDTTGFGTYKRELTRDYGKYWWCTGFKRGHLRVEEPAKELRTSGTITMKDAEMTRLFVEALKKCGFSEAQAGQEIGLDQFSVDGNNVRFVWQNISAAETTMPIKVLAGANVLAAFLGPFAMAMMFFLDIGLLILAH